jgi:Holliday junction resolvase RusA-like endonuclease
VSRTGAAPAKSVFKLRIKFRLSQGRYRKENSRLPREDWGADLDNLIKPVIDALGPIIGYRKKWLRREGGGYREVGTRTAADAKVVELVATKENSGSDEERLDVEIEAVQV